MLSHTTDTAFLSPHKFKCFLKGRPAIAAVNQLFSDRADISDIFKIFLLCQSGHPVNQFRQRCRRKSQSVAPYEISLCRPVPDDNRQPR